MTTAARCPNVRTLIEKARSLRAAGRCWCECVDRDIPEAERHVAEGHCAAAHSVISAALRRCSEEGQPMPEGHDGGEGGEGAERLPTGADILAMGRSIMAQVKGASEPSEGKGDR